MILISGETPFSFTAVSSGLFLSDEEWVHPSRQIDSYEVIYAVCGEISIKAGDTRYTLEKGDTLLLRPGVTHRGFAPSIGRTSFYWAHFYISDLDALGIRESFLPGEGDYGLTGFFRQLLHVANTPDYPPFAADMALLTILQEVAVAQRAKRQAGSRLVREAAEWIRINADQALTVKAVADYFGYNPDYLSLLFKKATGQSLKQAIAGERMKQAKNLLLTTGYSVKEIAGKLGWEDENGFINFFKYHESEGPAAFRNRSFNTHMNKK